MKKRALGFLSRLKNILNSFNVFNNFNNSSNKGQFTVFVVLGFVMFIVVVIILMVVSAVSTQKLEAETRSAVQEFIDATSINYYVYTCLDNVVNNAVMDYAGQGTFYLEDLNDNDLGKKFVPHVVTLVDSDSDVVVNLNVSYGISDKDLCPIVDLVPPMYPKNFTRLASLMGLYNGFAGCVLDRNNSWDSSGFFGLNNLMKLCYVGSPNSVNIPGQLSSPCLNSITLDKNKSFEYNLQSVIEKGLDSCLNFSLFEDIGGHNVTLDTNRSVNISIILNKESLSVRAEYPFIVKLRNRAPVLTSQEFTYASPLRITRLQNYVSTLLEADSKNVFFNLSNNYAQHNNHPRIREYYDSNFEVTIRNVNNPNNVPDLAFDRILEVKDRASFYEGNNLVFRVAIKNRRPALDLIHESILSDGVGSLGVFDLLIPQDREFIFSPVGYDPDDRLVRYEYSGWKEDYNETCEIIISGSSISFDCVKDFNVAPLNWSNSGLFLETKRQANYTPTLEEIGPRLVNITVFDSAGLMDWQEVRLLIFDLPTAELDIPSIYPGVPRNILSVEDPITLSGEGSTSSEILTSRITEYVWKGFKRNVVGTVSLAFEKNTTSDNFLVVPISSFNIVNISKLNFTETGTYDLELVVWAEYQDLDGFQYFSVPSVQEVNVTSCIPFRDFSPSYPYHTSVDPFYANHTCCLGELNDPDLYILVPSFDNVVCFSGVWFGAYPRLEVQVNTLKKESDLGERGFISTGNINTFSMPSGSNVNDIFQLNFSRVCDGTRGNICAGTMNAVITLNQSCSYNLALGNRQCVGPGVAGISSVPGTCVNYSSNQNFESLFMQGPSAACLEVPACSNTGVNGYGSNGPLICQRAFCDGQGGCTFIGANSGCSCSQGCGAECYPGFSFNWTGTSCMFGCTSNTCVFSNRNLVTKCPNPTNDASYSGSTFCLALEGAVNYCYSGVQCTSNGVINNRVDRCHKGLNNADNVCYHSSLSGNVLCNSDGTCNLQQQSMASVTCPEGQTKVCNPDSGVQCQPS